jgi:hypothetical protein
VSATVDSLIIDLDMICVTSEDERVIDLAKDMMRAQSVRVAELEAKARELDGKLDTALRKLDLISSFCDGDRKPVEFEVEALRDDRDRLDARLRDFHNDVASVSAKFIKVIEENEK